jgi:hypothetical protein
MSAGYTRLIIAVRATRERANARDFRFLREPSRPCADANNDAAKKGPAIPRGAEVRFEEESRADSPATPSPIEIKRGVISAWS